MLPLRRVLIDYDLGLLRAMAGLWGVELQAGEARAAAEELAPHLLTAAAVQEILDTLDPSARAVLEALVAAGGALPLAQLARQHGEIRAMGPGRRDRELPWLAPTSPLETLWYRGLVGRAFGEARPVSQEYLFIPTDLLPLLPQASPAQTVPGRPAAEPAEFLAAGGGIVDDLATALAYLQNAAHASDWRRRFALAPFLLNPHSQEFVLHLAARLGLLEGAPPRPAPGRARPFLEAARADQHQRLVETWQTDAAWNDLAHVPGLALGRPQESQPVHPNDPLIARQAILVILKDVPPLEWWLLDSFIQAVKERTPDFQRPAGDYDSWFIRDAATGDYLRGFTHWDRIEGGLIRYLICGPLHWLGLADLSPAEPGGDSAFRLTWAARSFLRGEAWPADPPAVQPRLEADGAVSAPRAMRPYDRFTLARFTEWDRLETAAPEGPVYSYRITASSLAGAHAQGVAVRHVLAFLAKAAANPVPRNLTEAIGRWEREGTEAVICDTTVLRAKSPEALERLRLSPKVKALLGRPLGPAAVEVRRQDVAKLRLALLEAGMLAEVQVEGT